MKKAIYTRRSHRSYAEEGLGESAMREIEGALSELTPLYPEIKTKILFLKREDIHSLMRWTPPQVLAIYSEPKPGYLANAGFLMGQLDLYLQSRGFGACYIGLGRPLSMPPVDVSEDMQFVIMLAVGKTKERMRESVEEFSRRPQCEISYPEDPRLAPAALAPSAMNTQPWYFLGEGESYHAYRSVLSRSNDLARMNTIDVGIALSHIYVSYPESFRYFCANEPPVLSNRVYIGSFTI